MSIDRCFECGDLGFVVRDNARRPCWRVVAGAAHNAPNAAARMLARAVDDLSLRQIRIDAQHFEIAKLLTRFTTDRPFERARLLEFHFALPLRQFHCLIEDLRSVWLLPVGSRKVKPVGYWIITDQNDFHDWVRAAKSAPITQLSTIARVARRNFPVFAEQLELEFWQDRHGSDAVRQAA